jgi:ankyrin repeat protein
VRDDVLGNLPGLPDADGMNKPSSNWQAYRETMVVPPSLGAAAKTNDLRELRRLLDAGAEIDAADARGYSALMFATYFGHVEAFEYLLEHGADPDSADRAGNSVLMAAAFKGDLSLVKRLVSAGAKLDARNAAGQNALNFAEQFGRDQVAQFLAGLGVALPL